MNLGPIIVNIITKNKNKIDVPVVTELSDLLLAKPAFQQACIILVYHYLIFLFVPFYQLAELIGPHRFFINTFLKQLFSGFLASFTK